MLQELDEIPPELWKTKKFDALLFPLCNAVYKRNTIERWTKGCILPFPTKGELGITKNNRGITLTPLAAEVYNSSQSHRTWNWENILKKSELFSEKSIHNSPDSNNPSNYGMISYRILEVIILFADFSNAFDSIHREKMKQILLAHGLPNETVTDL